MFMVQMRSLALKLEPVDWLLKLDFVSWSWMHEVWYGYDCNPCKGDLDAERVRCMPLVHNLAAFEVWVRVYGMQGGWGIDGEVLYIEVAY